MGVFNFSTSTQPQNTIDKGRAAFIAFHNQSTKYQGYDWSMNEALSIVAANGSTPSPEKDTIFLDALGGVIIDIQSTGMLGGWGLDDSMEALADKSDGRLPSQTSFFTAVGNEASNPSFIDITRAVAPEVAMKIADGAVAVGNSVIETGKYVTMLAPLAITGALLYILFLRSKSLGGA